MSAEPVRYEDADGSVFAAEIMPPDAPREPYRVDLLRASVDTYGLAREQRLTVGEYSSWGEAEEHLYEIEDGLAENGLGALGDDAQRLREQPYEDDVFYLAATYPLDESVGEGNAAAHLLAVGKKGIDSAALAVGERDTVESVVERLDRILAVDGVETALAATTPRFDSDDIPVRHVDSGGTAHWFQIVERDEDQDSPYELRYFRALDTDDEEQHAVSYPVMPLLDVDASSAWPLPGLTMYLQKGDVYMAQQFAHDVAEIYDQDFPDPLALPALNPEPEYYFGFGVGPNNEPSLEAVKTWMDGADRRFDTLTVGEYGTYNEAGIDEDELEIVVDTKGVEAAMNLAERMAAAGGYLDPTREDPRIFFEDDAPPDMFMTNCQRDLNIPSYGLGAVTANGESFLDVVKTWGDDSYARLVIPQPDWETAEANASVAGEMLEAGRLQDAMRLVELAGIEVGVIDPKRDDPRLFMQGPPDSFTTIREDEIDDSLARYGMTWRETQEWVAEPTQESQKTEIENPYWHLETLPVNNPDGEPLGHALHMLVYPGLGQAPEQGDTPVILDDEPFQMLEIANFETVEAADKFGKEFNGYLMPGVLEGPELAVEVARLEGLPVEWKMLESDDMTAYQNGELTLTRDLADWHLYNPNAERDARLTAEEPRSDRLHQPIEFDPPESEGGMSMADLDL